MNMKKHTRRPLLGAAVLGAGAAASPAFLSACGPGGATSDQKTDKVVTIVASSLPTTVDPAQKLGQLSRHHAAHPRARARRGPRAGARVTHEVPLAVRGSARSLSLSFGHLLLPDRLRGLPSLCG